MLRLESPNPWTKNHFRKSNPQDSVVQSHSAHISAPDLGFGNVKTRPSCRFCIPGTGLLIIFLFTTILAGEPRNVSGSVYDFFRLKTQGTVFAIDPDLMIRSIDPRAPDQTWTIGEGWGFGPLFFHSKVPGRYDRIDFLYPFGCREESHFRYKLRFTPFFESRWSKLPPFEGFIRCLTFYKGRSDLGQNYWGFFPFYGYTHRRYGVDHNFFLLFPLYYESTEDGARTFRFLWPLVTYSSAPGRSAFKVWPLYGEDSIRNDYFNRYALWPFFQRMSKYPGTDQASDYTALPFPLYVRQEDSYSSSTHILWPIFTLYEHYASGHHRYSFRPFVTYGSGGGIEELSILFFYSSKKDLRKASTSTDSKGYVSVSNDEVVTERSFLKMSTIKKRYRKGCLVYAKYRFWPFAEYIWDLERGSRLKVPEIIPFNDTWWDLNLGRLLRFVDFRDTPITSESSILFGLRQKTEIKQYPFISCPPKPGDDNWSELITGSFGKR